MRLRLTSAGVDMPASLVRNASHNVTTDNAETVLQVACARGQTVNACRLAMCLQSVLGRQFGAAQARAC